MRARSPTLLAGVFLSAACGCGPAYTLSGTFEELRPRPASVIAVVPCTNDTVDMDCPVELRKHIPTFLEKRGYKVMGFEECDTRLREHGITQGGQLLHIDQTTLGDVLGVDHVFYGNVDAVFKKWQPEASNPLRHVWYASASFKLVHIPTGETLWETSVRRKRGKFNTASASIKAAAEYGMRALPECRP